MIRVQRWCRHALAPPEDVVDDAAVMWRRVNAFGLVALGATLILGVQTWLEGYTLAALGNLCSSCCCSRVSSSCMSCEAARWLWSAT